LSLGAGALGSAADGAAVEGVVGAVLGNRARPGDETAGFLLLV